MAKYKWGIESSAEEESGMLQGGTGCKHEHDQIYQAVDCLSATNRLCNMRGERFANAIIGRADGDKLTDEERDIEIYGLDRGA